MNKPAQDLKKKFNGKFTLPSDRNLILDLHGAHFSINLEQHFAALVCRSTAIDTAINYASVSNHVRFETVRRVLRDPNSIRARVPRESNEIKARRKCAQL